MIEAIVLIVVLAALWYIHGHLAEVKSLLHLQSTAIGQSLQTPPPAESSASPPAVTAPSAALPGGIDTPDARGFVALTGLPAGNYYSKIRFSIGEVGAALTGTQHASVALNTGFLANGRWITTQFIGVCAEIEAVTDGTTGATTYRLKQPQVTIPNTIALPPSFTVSSATAHFAALPDPNTSGGGGFSPNH